jgi:hypothetical protein
MPSKYRPVTKIEEEKLKQEAAAKLAQGPKPDGLTALIQKEYGAVPDTPPQEKVSWPWRAAGVGTRVGSGILSGIVGALPSPITTPAAAAIGGAGEALAQKLESPSGTPIDKSTVGLEAGLSAIPFGKVFSGSRRLVNAARGAGLAEIGNVLRRWNSSGNYLPQTLGEGAWDALSLALGAAGGAITPIRGGPSPTVKVDPLTDVMEQATMQHGPQRPQVVYTDKGPVNLPADAPRVVKRGGVSIPPTPPPAQVVADPALPGAASVEGYAPTPPVVKEAQRKVADSLISHDDPLKDFNKAGFDADQIAAAERKLNETVRKAENKRFKAEESADLQHARTTEGGTELKTIVDKDNVETARSLNAQEKFKQGLTKARGQADIDEAKRVEKAAKETQRLADERAAAEKIAADKEGLKPGDPVVIESSKIKTPEGTESSKTVWRRPPPPVDKDGGDGIGGGPSGPKPTYSMDKIPSEQYVRSNTYTNKREALRDAEAYGGLAAGIDIEKLPGKAGYVVKFPKEPSTTKPPLGPAAQKFQNKVDDVLKKTTKPPDEPPSGGGGTTPVAPKTKKGPKGGGGGGSSAPPSGRGSIPAVKTGPKASSAAERLEKVGLHGGKMTKAEAEAAARRLGGRVHQYGPRKYTVLFDDIEAERQAARAEVEAPKPTPKPEKFDAPRSNGNQPIPVDTSYMGGLSKEEFSRYMELAPYVGTKRTAEELAEWKALHIKKGQPAPSSTKTAKFAESDQAGDELDALLTATRGPDWDKVKINPSGHGTLPPDEATSIMQDLAKKANASGPSPASANFFRNRADALGDLNPFGYKATKAAEAAGEIPASPHYRVDERGRPFTPARMQGAELSAVRKAARENPTPEDLERAGRWFTDKPTMAQSFSKGQRGHVAYVDVPSDVAQASARKPLTAGSNQYLLDEASKKGMQVVSPDDLKKLPAPSPGMTRLFRGLGTQEAVNTVDLTSESLKKMTPQQQSKALSEIVKKFQRQAKDQKGAAAFEVLTRVGLGSAGALAGAVAMPDDPLTGAIIGAAGGAMTPSVARALINRVATNPNMGTETMKEVAYKIEDSAKTFFRMLPDYQRFNLLADVRNLPINIWVGPYGSAIMASMEHLLSGDTRGWHALKMLVNPKNLAGEWWHARAEGHRLIRNASERTEGQLGKAGPEWFRWMTSQPGEAMTAGDVAARNILMRAGFSPEEARRVTLTSDPYSPPGRGISNFKKGAQSEDGKSSWMVNMILPFYRTATNQAEQSMERAPLFLGMLWQRYVGGAPKVNLGRKLAQQGISNGVVAPLSYIIGLNTDDENTRWVNKFINNFAGQYGMIASAAFMAGQASRKNKSVIGAVTRSLNESTPLPTLDFFNKIGSLARDAVEDNRPDRTVMQQMPVKMIPGFLDPDNELSFPSVIGKYMNPPKPERGPVRRGTSKYRPVSKR